MTAQSYNATYIGSLRRRYTERATYAALNRAFAIFEQRFPEWAESLFDRHFIKQRVVPHLLNNTTLTPQIVADAWASQLTQERSDAVRRHARAAQPVSAAFLRLLDHELRAADMTSNIAISGGLEVLQ